MQFDHGTKIVVFIVLVAIATAFLTLTLVYCYDVTSQRKQTAEAVAIEHKLNNPSITLDSTSFNLRPYGTGQSRILVTCVNGLEFVIYTNNNIIQVFEPTENNNQSIPKRCN